jgi:hypothetical protein
VPPLEWPSPPPARAYPPPAVTTIMTLDASTTVNSLILDMLVISISLGFGPEDPAPDEWADE